MRDRRSVGAQPFSAARHAHRRGPAATRAAQQDATCALPAAVHGAQCAHRHGPGADRDRRGSGAARPARAVDRAPRRSHAGGARRVDLGAARGRVRAMAVPEGLIAQAWTVLCAVLAPAVFGAGIVRWLGLGPAHGWRVFAAWSYLVGQYTLAHATSLWLLARQPLPGWCLPLFALLGGSALLLAHRRRGIDRSDTPPAHDRWLGLLCIVLAIVCIDQFLRVNVQPILASDEGDIWSAKAKVLYCADSMPVPFGLALYARHTDYPLFDPLVQVLAFASHGRVLQWENRLPIQCFGISLLLLLSAALGHYTSRWLAAAAMVAFTSSLFFQCTTTAYADVMVAFALLAAVDGWLRWQQTGERVWWRLCCFGLAA